MSHIEDPIGVPPVTGPATLVACGVVPMAVEDLLDQG
jgi:hypothetical protein